MKNQPKDAVAVLTATPDDLAFLQASEARIFSDAWREVSLLSHLASPTSRTLVARLGEERVGYLLGSVIPPEGEVYRVATLPEYRRRGVGRALLAAFLSECEVTFLEVRRSNAAARALYEGAGFLLVGERRGYYKDPKEDACVYQRGANDENTGL